MKTIPLKNRIGRVLHQLASSRCKFIHNAKCFSVCLILVCLISQMSCAKRQTLSPAFNGLNMENSAESARYSTVYNYAKLFPNYTQISIGIFSDTVVEYYGVIRYKDTIYSIDNKDEVFEIGSITKVFNGTILAKYVEEQKISLSSNISELLPVKINGDPAISILQLANHSSGIERNPPDIKSEWPTRPYPENIYSDSMLLNYFSNNLKLQTTPGVKWSYSNIGSQLLGYLLCKIEGYDYETMLQKEIFQKYGMENTTTNKLKVINKLVNGLDKDGNPCNRWPWKTGIQSGGACYSNVTDMIKFAMASCNTTDPQFKHSQTVTFKIDDADSVFQNSTAEVGLEWIILNHKSGEKWIWHNGANIGYYSHLLINPYKKCGVVMLSNIDSSNPDRRRTQEMIEELLVSASEQSVVP